MRQEEGVGRLARDGGQVGRGGVGRIWEGLSCGGDEVAHNAGPHLPQHETDHDIDVAWVLRSPEDEECGAIHELPVPVLDDTVAGILSAVFVHHDRAGEARGCTQLHIVGYGLHAASGFLQVGCCMDLKRSASGD